MEKLTFDKMKTKVWEAADILRGSIDSSDYKNYIFGMLFLKRLSDVFEEEAERIEKETGDLWLIVDEKNILPMEVWNVDEYGDMSNGFDYMWSYN
jgi:type I restriction-modification system DNA methylase subunit